jgi:hypothetical protein
MFGRRYVVKFDHPFYPVLDTGVPLVSSIFPKPAFASADVAEVLDRLDSRHVFRVLVTQLALHAQP